MIERREIGAWLQEAHEMAQEAADAAFIAFQMASDLQGYLAECVAAWPEVESEARRAGTCSHLDHADDTRLDSAEVELRTGVVSGAGMFADGV